MVILPAHGLHVQCMKVYSCQKMTVRYGDITCAWFTCTMYEGVQLLEDDCEVQ